MSISFFREKYQWVTKFILVAIVVSFIFSFGYFGVSSLQSGVPTGTAAKVNGEKIPLVRFYNVRDNLYRQLGLGRSDTTPETRNFLNVTALQQLVENKLLAQKARELGFYVSDEELSRSIMDDPAFQINGNFIGAEAYRNTIRQALNIDLGEFEKTYREELLIMKLRELISSSVKISEDELYNIYKVQNENVSLYYAEFRTGDFTDTASISDDEIREHYDKNREYYLTPEKRKIKFVKVSREDFINKIHIGDDDIRSYYKSYSDEFKDEDGNLKSIDEARPEISGKLKAKLADRDYRSFALLLSRNERLKPVDKILEENALGSSMESGLFSIDQNTEDIPQDIRKQAFQLGAGETSYINSEENIWVFQLAEVKLPEQRTLEEARTDIAGTLSRIKGRKAAETAAKTMLNLLAKSAGSYKDVAEELGVSVNETAPFSRTEPPEALDVEDLKFDAFSLNNSRPHGEKVYQKEGSYFVISLKEKFNIAPEEFEEEKPEIKNTQLIQRERELLNEWLARLRENAEVIPNPGIFNSP